MFVVVVIVVVAAAVGAAVATVVVVACVVANDAVVTAAVVAMVAVVVKTDVDEVEAVLTGLGDSRTAGFAVPRTTSDNLLSNTSPEEALLYRMKNTLHSIQKYVKSQYMYMVNLINLIIEKR